MMKGKFDKAMFEEDCSFVEEILNVPRKIAKKIVNGESFYNPLTKRIQTKESLLKGDCDRRADRIKQWIDKEEKRISDFPGYDGVEPYLMYAKDTVDMLRSNSPSYNIRKFKETKEPTRKEKDMPKKKKEKAPQEEPAKTVRASSDGETPKEKKAESQSAAQGETQAERKPREPQMVTVNGDKVTHGHAYQSNVNPQDWYFTARLNGEQLKPQKMDPADVAAYDKKEITVPELMQRYYPTKLMPRVPEEAFKYPNGLAGPSGPITIDKFNVYKETDETRADYGRDKFYAQVGDKKMSTPASREDLNAYFDRVMTPGQLVERNFGERLHLPSHYAQFRLPEGIDPKGVRVAKDRSDGRWRVSADLGEGRGRTSKQEISFDDGYSLFKAKSATREQIAAKYLGQEITAKLAAPLSMEKSASMKV